MKLIKNNLRASHLTISLTSMDLYKMTFYKCGNDIKIIKEVDGIYNDMLRSQFSELTGLYTHL